jgi:pyruvate,water dikinase
MHRIGEYFSKWSGGKKRPLDETEAERLRIAFKERYHHFKLLLNANNRALRTMAEIEHALGGGGVFGMAFVRERCTSVSVNVLRMVNALHHLSPGKYAGLKTRFDAVNREVNRIISSPPPVRNAPLVMPLSEIDRTSAGLAGGKMAMLGEMKNRLGLRVPDGFVITTHAYERFFLVTGLRDEINRLVQSADSGNLETLHALGVRIRKRIAEAPVPEEIAVAVTSAFRSLAARVEGPLSVAMRSSALGEDAAGSSFAGQYHSELNVGVEDLLDAYKAVISGKYSLQAMAYRYNLGLRDEDVPMAVGCLRMVAAVSGGVAYSKNPVDGGEKSVIINSVWGLPKAVVDGTTPCDLFAMGREDPHGLIREEVQVKPYAYVGCDGDSGLCREPVPADRSGTPSLAPAQRVDLARIALRLEGHFGGPQDLEWAVASDGAIYLLQCRPLFEKTSRSLSPDKPEAIGAEPELLSRGGITASPGAASGEVFLADRHADILRFPTGGVLVTRQALPVWACLMDRAAAVVTTRGGVAGHLASVAREFGVPALFSLKDATRLLKAGQTVTVDADRRTVYAGRVPALLKRKAEAQPFGEKSPVFNLLKAAAGFITPLHLLDPEDPGFQPENCRSFHDITRFVHEKSVSEMFVFGKDHNFPERSGKQLHYKVPMQWWILNLDDGFKRPVTGKYVSLEEIDSIPMLAFWEGFAAVPWDGPPPLDHRGFLSVMFHSTANPDLVTGVRTQYSEQNYFMISKNFCSLNSRLGYHFSILEALVGGRSQENYIRFQFKGGAADMDRRVRRAEFIGEILQTFGFWTVLREDHLTARVREEGERYMKERMAILGYLTLHSRQLDMIMGNPGQVAFYREKLEKDIRERILGEIKYSA